MDLEVYYNAGSQPCRSVFLFMKINNIDFRANMIDFDKGEHMTPEFLAMNPRHTLPTLKDDDFVICESVAMVKYLARKHRTPEHWYPSDLRKRTRVDELLDWHHTNIRKQGADVFASKMLVYYGSPALTQEQEDEKYDRLDSSLGQIEHFLQEKKFLCGDDITIADIFIANEVLQPTMCGRDFYQKRPNVKAWMDRVRERLNPVWDELLDQLKQIVSDIVGGSIHTENGE